MKSTPKNTMVTKDDEIVKDSDKKAEKENQRPRRFYFPQHQRTVVAETREEAEEIINKEKK